MSERVEREFKEWQERYVIPHSMEFQVKTLLKLQEEYDNIVPAENNTKTRETLLHMINDVRSRITLKERIRDKDYFDITSKIDGVWVHINKNDKNRIKVQFEDLIDKVIRQDRNLNFIR